MLPPLGINCWVLLLQQTVTMEYQRENEMSLHEDSSFCGWSRESKFVVYKDNLIFWKYENGMSQFVLLYTNTIIIIKEKNMRGMNDFSWTNILPSRWWQKWRLMMKAHHNFFMKTHEEVWENKLWIFMKKLERTNFGLRK